MGRQIVCPECGTVHRFVAGADNRCRCPHPKCRAEFPADQEVAFHLIPDAGLPCVELAVLSAGPTDYCALSGGGPWSVGRDPDCNVVLDDQSVGPKALRVSVVAGEPLLCHVTDANGREFQVTSGDYLSAGNVKLQLWLRYTYDDAVPAPPPPLWILPEPIDLAVIQEEGSALLVGRNRNEVDVALPVRRVSRRHALLRREGGDVIVYDQGSRLGLFVNGKRVSRARIRTNDAVCFGPCPYRFDGTKLWLANVTGTNVVVRNAGFAPSSKAPLIVRELTFDVKENEFFGVIGPSGSGKTTLLALLAGYVRLTQGSISLDGISREHETAGVLAGAVAYVPQDDIVHSSLTVYQELTYAARLRVGGGATAAQVRHCADAALSDVQMKHRRAARIRNLSGGERRRVNLGVELVARPRLLLLDEPTSGIDPGTETDLMLLFKKVSRQGCTVVCTTHTMENIDVFDRVAVLHEGQLVFVGPPRELLRHFDIGRYSALYAKLRSGGFDEWRSGELPAEPPGRTGELDQVRPDQTAPKPTVARQLFVLASRYAREILADPRLVGILALQPLAIAWLLRAALSHEVADAPLLFLCAVAAFWLGLNNAARVVVSEAALVRRELRLGISPMAYLGSKTMVLLVCGFLQVLLIALVMLRFSIISRFRIPVPAWSVPEPYRLFRDSAGAAGLHFVLVLWLVLVAGTAIGLALSAFARSTSWATVAVPIVTIPHIAFASQVMQISIAKLGEEPTFRWALSLFNAVQHGYRWMRGLNDREPGYYCWGLFDNTRLNFSFLCLVLISAAFLALAHMVLKKRYVVSAP